MKILFMGTPDFAADNLRALLSAGEDVVCVITQPDKPKNRGMKLLRTPAAQVADEAKIPVYQPETLKDNAIMPLLTEYNPELIVVVAYGKRLPKYILDYPKYGCINIHGSLLPKYRGAAPIQWCIINGDKVSGVTSMYLAEGMDTGDMIIKREIPVSNDDNCGTLFDKLSKLGGEVLVETVEAIKNNTAAPVPQKDSEATYAPMLNKEMGRIDWSKNSADIINLVRGLQPWPSAFSYIKGKRFKIISASHSVGKGLPGEIIRADSKVIIAAGEGAVSLDVIQFENKNKMNISDYIRGNPDIFIKGGIIE